MFKKLFGFGNNDVVSNNGISSPPTNSAVDHNETTKMEGRSILSKTTNPPTNKRVNFRDSDESDDNNNRKSVLKGSKKHHTSARKKRSPSHERFHYSDEKDGNRKSKKHHTSVRKSRSPSQEDNAKEKPQKSRDYVFKGAKKHNTLSSSESRDSSRSPSPSREEKIIHINKLIKPVLRKNRIVAYQCLSFDKEAGFPCLRTCSSLDKIKAHLEYCRKK